MSAKACVLLILAVSGWGCGTATSPPNQGANLRAEQGAKRGAASQASNANADDRDWQDAKHAGTADSYIAYLSAHPDGMFAAEARQAARKFLTVKLMELPDPGAVLVTSGFGKITLDSHSGVDSEPETVRAEKGVELNGSELTFRDPVFHFHFGNAVFEPLLADASAFVYGDGSGRAKLFDFAILLRGASQSAPVFEPFHDALMNAIGEGDLPRVKALLAAQPDLNAVRDDFGTPLALAAELGRLEIVRMLLAHHADVDARPDDSPTALMLASQQGKADVVRALLAADANVNMEVGPGLTALQMASQNNHADVVRLLKSAGATAR